MRALIRLVLAVVVAALGVTAIGVAITPELARIVTANEAVGAEIPDFGPLSRRSIVYDAAGNVIDTFQVENREPFTIDKVPPAVIAAVLAVEDEAFYRHKGVNAKSLTRAMLANVAAGEVTQGGSTITQQLVKNELLTSTRDANRKLLEAAYAVQLEKKLTKDQILERYLNTVFFGNNAYGLQSAAETYFGKSVEQLTLIEGAFLAGLIRNPVGYDPIFRPERSRSRFRQVLSRLVAVQRITPGEADRLGDEWPLPEKLQRPANAIAARSYFTAEVRNQLLNRSNILGSDYQSRYNALFRGGVKIYTTLNPYLQFGAEASKAQRLPNSGGQFEAAIVTLDNENGAVRAMVGGPGFDKSQVNLALSRRQTGSAAKIYILSAAYAAGVQPNDLIDGTLPCTLPDPNNPKEPFTIKGGPTEPKLAPLAEHTAKSTNCSFAKLSQIVGLPRVVEMGKRLGVKGPLYPYASFATGANEISPIDMATALSTLANGGVRKDPYYIERIEGPDGKILYQHATEPVGVLDKAVADRIVDTLKGPLTSGTASRRGRLADGRVAFGKTGTQDDNTNAWFVGATRQFTTAVWMGDPNAYTPMASAKLFPDCDRGQVTGGCYPTMIWKTYMDAIHKDLPKLDWDKPGALKRKAARLYLPGVDCVVAGTNRPSGGSTSSTARGRSGGSTTTVAGSQIDLSRPVVSASLEAVVYDCKSRPPVITTSTSSTIPGDSTTIPGESTSVPPNGVTTTEPTAPPTTPATTAPPAAPAATAPPTTKKP
ncbi:MAG TPA: transglycosylase domain-containing protein [Acidimicrobiales bacterium]